MAKLDMEELLNAGAHFGHQTHKWNPKMKRYVYGERNGVYIIDLDQTIPLAEKAYEFIKKTAASGRSVLFVGTKRQASNVVKDAAEECGAYYVAFRWLGGMLTNFKTIGQSIDKLRKVEKMKETGDYTLLTKKEQSRISKEVDKLERNLGGIKNMRKLPGAIFIIDPDTEDIAVAEARNLNIPVVAITDTNCDPTKVDYVVPGNDDAIKSITMFAQYFANAVAEGNSGKKDGTAGKDKNLEQEMMARHESKKGDDKAKK
jgi:small subunit ribosomal protein S2